MSDRLKRLEGLGIVESSVYEKQRTQKVYTVTDKGIDLIPLLVEIIYWSAKYKNGLNVSDEFIGKLESNRKKVLNTIRKNVMDRNFV